MLGTLFKILLTICFAVILKAIHDQSMFNPNSDLIQIQDVTDQKIRTLKTELNPLKFKIDNLFQDLSFSSLNNKNPGYIINDKNKLISLNSIYSEKNDFSIHENEKLIIDLNLSEQMNEIMKYFKEPLTMNIHNYLSLYRGKVIVSLTKNTNNTCIFVGLTDNTIIYLFNPKHKNDIIGTTDVNSIKKWGIKVILNKNDVLYLPPEWFYAYEVNDETIMSKITSDTYLTFAYNYLRSV